MPGKADTENGKPAAKKVADPRSAEQREEGARRWRTLQSGLRAIVSEMRRVTWPSREEWVSATAVTVGLVALVSVWTALISRIVEFLLGLIKGGS
jgi:preprotein translocase SecE subunit